MGLDPSAVGYECDPIAHYYGSRDVILYALGIGATCAELDYLYEGRGPRVYPSYAVVPALEALRAVLPRMGGTVSDILHHGQSLTLHRPFAPEATLYTKARVLALHDLGRMAEAVVHTETRDTGGALMATTGWSLLYRSGEHSVHSAS